MRGDSHPLDAVTTSSNVLVLGPSVEEAVDTGCKHLLSASDEPVLAVTFTLSPSAWVENWRERIGDLPDELVIVSIADSFTQPGELDLGEHVTVEYLSSPGDLTGLGMIISKYLERWHETDRRMHVCLDSLTTLLQYEEFHNVYRFTHLITTRLDGAGGHAHFHLDPATQEEKDISTLSSSFDALAQYEADEWDVKSR